MVPRAWSWSPTFSGRFLSLYSVLFFDPIEKPLWRMAGGTKKGQEKEGEGVGRGEGEEERRTEGESQKKGRRREEEGGKEEGAREEEETRQIPGRRI